MREHRGVSWRRLSALPFCGTGGRFCASCRTLLGRPVRRKRPATAGNRWNLGVPTRAAGRDEFLMDRAPAIALVVAGFALGVAPAFEVVGRTAETLTAPTMLSCSFTTRPTVTA